MPVSVTGIHDAIAISAGAAHVCALNADGTVDCWGDTVGSSTPTMVSGINNATAISAGSAQTCVLLATGAVDCWGANFWGQLGNGTTNDSYSEPVAVTGITNNGAAVVSGGPHVCAGLIGGSVECWGDDNEGELGDGKSANGSGYLYSTTPVQVSLIP